MAVAVPLLRKDFLVAPVAGRSRPVPHGADAVLLIAAALGDDELAAMLADGRATSGWARCVETHARR